MKPLLLDPPPPPTPLLDNEHPPSLLPLLPPVPIPPFPTPSSTHNPWNRAPFSFVYGGAGIEPLLLDTQYRMHPLIAHMPSKLFYAGRLMSGLFPCTFLLLPPPSACPVLSVPWPPVPCNSHAPLCSFLVSSFLLMSLYTAPLYPVPLCPGPLYLALLYRFLV